MFQQGNQGTVLAGVVVVIVIVCSIRWCNNNSREAGVLKPMANKNPTGIG